MFMPAIQAAMGLTNFQVAFLLGVRQGGFGVVNLVAGAIVDQMKSNWGAILTGCMVWAALGFVAVALSPNLGVLIFAVAIVSSPEPCGTCPPPLPFPGVSQTGGDSPYRYTASAPT